jgi:type I restriction enzyme S subunit
MEINLPDLPTQRKIAGILSAYDDLIENNLRRIKILEQMTQSLYREWFVHFRFPRDPSEASAKAGGHESATFKDSELGRIPEGWQATTLGEFVDKKSVQLQTGPFGTQLKASHYSHEGTPVINVRNNGFGTIRPEKL